MEGEKFWDLTDQAWMSTQELGNAMKPKLHGNPVLMGLDYDKFLEKPLDYLDKLFVDNSLPLAAWEMHVINALHFKVTERKISNFFPQKFKVPSLNDPELFQLKNGQAVTFRCMIQSARDSEFWPHQVTIVDPVTDATTIKSTLLRDVFKDVEVMADEGDLVEKETFIAITPPGENAWVSRFDPNATKGLAEECKRMKLDENEKGVISLPNYKELVPYLFQNHAETKPMACIIKMFQESNTEDIKPTDIVEVTGLIYFDEEVAEQEKDSIEGLLPGGLHKLPVMHVFSCIKLADGISDLPLLEGKLFPVMKVADVNLLECNTLLRELLSLSLGGDRYASVYLMTALIARVLKRDPVLDSPIGKFTLNISGIPENSEILEDVERVLKAIVPRTLKLDFTIDSMDGLKLTPVLGKMEILEPNLLEMASGTHVLIDETNLQEGKLSEAATRNVNVLTELISEQQVKYNYTFQHPVIPTRVPVVILSKSSSVLPHDMHVVVKQDTLFTLEERRQRIDLILKENSGKLRTYLTLARSIDLTIPGLFSDKSLSEDFEAFFGTRNQPKGFQRKMSGTEFSAFITSCRLWCLLNGELSITREHFNFWKDLELIRDSRFAPPPPAPL